MNFSIKRIESYSRGNLIFKTFFAWLVTGIPHGFMLGIYGIWFNIQTMLLPIVILFTGNMPESWFKYRIGYMSWAVRVYAYLYYLTEEKPAFGPAGTSEVVTLDVQQPEQLSRVMNFFTIFKAIAVIPHMICLGIMGTISLICISIGWFAILFTGSYPAGLFTFVENTYRWGIRVYLYLLMMSDEYPPFNGNA